MIAIREFGGADVSRHAHCVTVRTRGMYAPTRVDGRVPQWLQYDVVAAAPRSRFQDGELALTNVPDDAVHLVLTPTFVDQRSESPTPHIGVFRRLLLRRNVNPWVAFVHICARLGICYLLLRGLGPLLLLISLALGLALTITLVSVLFVPLTLKIMISFVWPIWRRNFEEKQYQTNRESAIAQRIASAKEEWLPTQLINTAPPWFWTGATSRCMSVGRLVNGTDAKTILQHRWQRFSHRFKGFRRIRARFARN